MPMLQLDGGVGDRFWVRAVMSFPNDLPAAQRCFAVEMTAAMIHTGSSDETHNVDAGTLRLLLEAANAESLKQQIVERTKRAIIAGDLLVAIYLMNRFCVPEPSINKAIFVAKEYAKKAKFGDGTPLNKSEPMVIKCWKEFYGVAHFWAAQRIYDAYPYVPANLRFEQAGFAAFLGVAQELFQFGVAYIPSRSKSQKPILDREKCWILPNTIQAKSLDSDRQPDLLLKTLKKYTAPKSSV